jgi:hypothetical protein
VTDPIRKDFPPCDVGNPFLGLLYPSALTATPQATDQGTYLMVTVRTGGTTVTVMLDRELALQWSGLLHRGASRCSKLIIPQANGGTPT